MSNVKRFTGGIILGLCALSGYSATDLTGSTAAIPKAPGFPKALGLSFQVGKTGAQPSAKSGTAARFLEALQKRDLKTVIDLTDAYQRDVAQIKAQNPQVLRAKLVKDYYDAKTATFSNNGGFWQNYTGALLDATGDPAQRIRLALGLVPQDARWKITETRADHVADSIQFGTYDRIIVYATVDYPSFDESPLIDGKFLKQTILEFDLNAKSQLLMSVGRLRQGDAQWDPIPFMILNASWQAEGLGGGYFTATSVGGRAPFSWAAKCGSVDLTKNILRVDVSGKPRDHMLLELNAKFPNNAFPLRCTVTAKDGVGHTDTIAVSVPRMFTGFSEHCWARRPWFDRGQGLPTGKCLDPVQSMETTGVAPVEPTASSNVTTASPGSARTSNLPETPAGYVTDFALVIPVADVNALNARCAEFDQTHKAQISIVTVRTLNGESLEKVGLELFRKWGIGRKGINDGLLLMLAIDDRQSRIIVGSGIEGIVTNPVAATILQGMQPDLRAGRYAAAFDTALDLLGKRLPVRAE